MSATELESLQTLKAIIDSGRNEPPDKSPLQQQVEAEVHSAPQTEGVHDGAVGSNEDAGHTGEGGPLVVVQGDVGSSENVQGHTGEGEPLVDVQGHTSPDEESETEKQRNQGTELPGKCASLPPVQEEPENNLGTKRKSKRSASREEKEKFPFSIEVQVNSRAYSHSCSSRRDDYTIENGALKLFHSIIECIDDRDQKFRTSFMFKSEKEINNMLKEFGLKCWVIKPRENSLIAKLAILSKCSSVASRFNMANRAYCRDVYNQSASNQMIH